MLALTAAASTLEVVSDGERTSFTVSFQDPEPELRSSVAFSMGFFIGIVAATPDGRAETFFTPLIDPKVGDLSPGMLTLFYVEERTWPVGTKFSYSLYDRDGNYVEVAPLLPPELMAMADGRCIAAYSMLTHDGRRLVSRMEGTNEVFELVATNSLPANLPPVRKWTIYGVKATHTDIGLHNSQYIQRHGAVKRIEDAARLVDAETLPYSDPAAYRYVMEGYWFWHNYPMDRGEAAAREIIEKYVKTGKMGIGVTCAGNHTHIYSPEEVCRSIYTQKALRERWGVDGHTMLMTDNPGMSWSIVQPYAEAGVRNILFSPNQWNPLPSTLWPMDKTVDGYTWNPDAGGGGNRIDVRWGSPLPMVFWWESPDAKSRILTVASTQYDKGLWRFGLRTRIDKPIETIERMTAKQLDRMNARYPYDVWIAATYGDDEPANAGFAKFCREWNAKWATPTFATVGDLDKPFDELRKFGDKIPVLRGEMTSGWLQHIAATPELMAEKLSADRALTAAEMKCAIDSATAGAPYPAEDFRRAWWHLMLNDEHSYGTSGYQGRRVFETWAQHRDWIEKAASTARTILSHKERKDHKDFADCASFAAKNEAEVLESRWYLVKVNSKGEIESIYDKELGRELLNGVANKFMYTRDNHKTWEKDAAKALGAEIVQKVWLDPDEKRIVIDNVFKHARDLFNDKRYYRYGYYAFPFDVPGARFYAQLNGPVVEAYKDLTGHTTDSFYGAREWAAAENGDFGVALIQLDTSLVEFGEVHPDKTAYEFGKRPTKSAIYSYVFNDWLQMHVPDGDSISPRFRYVITSYKGSWKDNHVPRIAENVARPFTAEAERRVRADAPNVILTALKAAEDGNGFIARFRETEGRRTTAKVVQDLIPGARIFRTSVIEENGDLLDGGELSIEPFAFATVRIEGNGELGTGNGKVAFAPPVYDGYEYTGLITRPRATHGEKDGQLYLEWGADMSRNFDHYELWRDGKFLASVTNEAPDGIPYRNARYEDTELPTHSRHVYKVRSVYKDGEKGKWSEDFSGLTRYLSEEEKVGMKCDWEFGEFHARYTGAQTWSWKPAKTDRGEILFMPKNAPWGKEVHGGIPICWPWFGAAPRADLPKHGLARYATWKFKERDWKTGILFELDSNDETRRIWPHDFHLEVLLKVAGDDSFVVRLTETNTGKEPFESAWGFHPYFRVTDAERVAVDGEKMPPPSVRIQSSAAEKGRCRTLTDLVSGRKVAVECTDNEDWFVWNPGIERTPLCETLGPDEWKGFYCVEPCTLAPRSLAPGESRKHEMSVKVMVSGSPPGSGAGVAQQHGVLGAGICKTFEDDMAGNARGGVFGCFFPFSDN